MRDVSGKGDPAAGDLAVSHRALAAPREEEATLPSNGSAGRHGSRSRNAPPRGGGAWTDVPRRLAELVAMWSDTGFPEADVKAAEQRVAEDVEDGPAAVVRVLAALDLAVRKVGGDLGGVLDASAPGRPGDSCLPHLLELLHHAGLEAAHAEARRVDAPARAEALGVLRTFWQAPRAVLARPLHDAQVMLSRRPFSS